MNDSTNKSYAELIPVTITEEQQNYNATIGSARSNPQSMLPLSSSSIPHASTPATSSLATTNVNSSDYQRNEFMSLEVHNHPEASDAPATTACNTSIDQNLPVCRSNTRAEGVRRSFEAPDSEDQSLASASSLSVQHPPTLSLVIGPTFSFGRRNRPEKEQRYSNFKCYHTSCEVSKRTKSALANHVLKAHAEEDFDKSKVVMMVRRLKTSASHICQTCQQSFYRPVHLRAHLKSLKHVKVLTEVRKVPVDTFELISKNLGALRGIDVTDEEKSLLSVIEITQRLRHSTQERSDSLATGASMDPDTLPALACDPCCRGFTREHHLVQHYRSLQHVKMLVRMGKLPRDSVDIVTKNMDVLKKIDVANLGIMINSLSDALDCLRQEEETSTDNTINNECQVAAEVIDGHEPENALDCLPPQVEAEEGNNANCLETDVMEEEELASVFRDFTNGEPFDTIIKDTIGNESALNDL